MERPSTRDGSSTPAPTTPSPSKRASTFAADSMAPFDPVSSERLNMQMGSEHRLSINSLGSPGKKGHSRDSSVSDKINQFNTLASQSKHLERKNADAALKRAVLGREEAEAEVRKYRDDVHKHKDEVRALKKEIEEGRNRERKVGERLETVMENYGRTKETHAHTQTLWEKEIRRMRKETFKSQSAIVDLQEKLNAARAAQKSAEASLEREKERSSAREQEAFQARYNQVGLQEQLEKIRSELDQALERVKLVEQERDAFKTLAKTEEDVARIASEGRLPLPPASQEDEDEFASPRKSNDSRAVSLSLVDVKSSASSEMEIEELTRLWQWEKQRADRAADQVEYLEAECSLRACSCMKKRPRSSMMGLLSPKRQKRAAAEPLPPLADPSDRMILSEKATAIPPPSETSAHAVKQPTKKKTSQSGDSEDRRATIFLPDLGTFRTVSMEEADAMERAQEQGKRGEPVLAGAEADDKPMEDAPPHVVEQDTVPERYSRTPSVEPPSFAIVGQERASLVSLLDAPHHQQQPSQFKVPAIPTTPGLMSEQAKETAPSTFQRFGTTTQAETRLPQPRRLPLGSQDPNVEMSTAATTFKTSYDSRPLTAQSFYTSTTTTSVPLREENSDPSMAKKLLALQRTPSRSKVDSNEIPTWDVNNPALTPTMTREQALAKIRERRGRAKSGNAGTATPYKGMIRGARGDRRDVSAPAGRKGRIGS